MDDDSNNSNDSDDSDDNVDEPPAKETGKKN